MKPLLIVLALALAVWAPAGIGAQTIDRAEVLPWIRLTLQGEELVRSGRYREALECFKKAELAEPGSTRIFMNTAVAWNFIWEQARTPGDRSEARANYLAALRRVLALDPLHADARYLMDRHLGIVSVIVPFIHKETGQFLKAAQAALVAGDTANAMQIFERALALERHPDILKGAGMTALQQGEIGTARAFLLESLKLNPVQHDTCMALGDLAEREKHFPEARDWYIRSLAGYPHHVAAMDRIAGITRAMGRPVRFLNLADPVPEADREVAPDNLVRIRELSEERKVNVFELQCRLVYHAAVREARAAYAKTFPGVPFVLTAEIETACVAAMVHHYRVHREAMGVTMAQFDTLIGLDAEGLLPAAVFFYRWRDEFAPEFIAYRDQHFDAFVKMLDLHL
ncbi:MAG: tetratricopeptide repeat protein [Planctomycetota bacterium]